MLELTRPKWKGNGRTRKKWFIKSMAIHWRDSRVEKSKRLLQKMNMNSHWTWSKTGRNIQYIYKHYLRLQRDGRIDETCMPEWAAKKWRW